MKNKYFVGKYNNPQECGGWIIGSFYDQGDPRKNDQIEILYKEHKKGDKTKPHFHKEKVEVVILLSGKVKYVVNDKEIILSGGEFIFIDVGNIIAMDVLDDSKLFAIHSPSLPKDKFIP